MAMPTPPAASETSRSRFRTEPSLRPAAKRARYREPGLASQTLPNWRSVLLAMMS
jgi:hypothetical protein